MQRVRLNGLSTETMKTQLNCKATSLPQQTSVHQCSARCFAPRKADMHTLIFVVLFQPGNAGILRFPIYQQRFGQSLHGRKIGSPINFIGNAWVRAFRHSYELIHIRETLAGFKGMSSLSHRFIFRQVMLPYQILTPLLNKQSLLTGERSAVS
jgi:hypothetical protein